ncbi:Dyp-type peroxidase [Microlunatus soli]|uniref:Putative iron-dependent peroxidase n=1 Tax=Microlunatus soli TaxID=630515 RepID=A0A1H2AH24_9ACTN|nr:Dyp-type peroxidase [Microlunatus soli]SDT45167.1 putative iron-dependent peroxidase [Microlunatus soli]
MTEQPRPQDVVRDPAPAAIFLVLTVRPGAEDVVGDLLADVASLKRGVGFKRTEDELSCVVGIGAQLWDRMYDAPRPAGLHPFRPVVGATHTAVATPGDLLFHLRARQLDLCFELAKQLVGRLSGSADVVDEVHGFRFLDERDMLGFVDGTENPTGADAFAAVQVGDEDPAHTGASYVMVQKYLHDLDSWEALSVEEQERAIGRHKLSDIEIADDDKASNSHVALNTITDADGNDLDILRDNLPFGEVGTQTFGTYYIGYAADPAVLEEMLTNMFIGKPPGNHDRILDFSTAVTGNLFFVPTQDFLEDPSMINETSTINDQATTSEPTVRDGSLNIGSLKRSTTA